VTRLSGPRTALPTTERHDKDRHSSSYQDRNLHYDKFLLKRPTKGDPPAEALILPDKTMLIQGLGDIWLLVQAGTIVIRKLHAAATTAPQEVKDLIDDAATFKALLRQTESSIYRHGTVLKRHNDVKAAIVLVFRRCGDMLDHLERIANAYENIVEREGEAPGDERRRRQWLKAIDNAYKAYQRVRWTTEDGALRELRQLLHEHEAHLQIVMSSLSMLVKSGTF
jgi:hypothetical protein